MLIRFCLALLMLLAAVYELFGQNTYSKIDELAQKTSGRTFEIIHKELDALCQSDSGKARAFFSWIAYNIKYDMDEYNTLTPDIDKQDAQVVMKSRKAVCQGYSNLFAELCKLSALECVVVSGHIREDGRYSPSSHAWNAVKIGSQWRLIDATWGAGVVNENGRYEALFDDNYFLASPERFIEDHYPFDPAWQLLAKPVSFADYRKPTWKYAPEKSLKPYAYQDTIDQWITKDSIDLLIDLSRRVIAFNSEIVAAREEACYYLTLASNICMERAYTLQEKTDWDNETESKKNLKVIKALYQRAQTCVELIGSPPPRMKSIVDSLKKTIKYNLSVIESY